MEKILIIEDEEHVRSSIRDLLFQVGYEVSEAENGREAIKLIENNSPDLILSDIMMPEMDGHMVLEELQKNPATSSIPFIFLTAKVNLSDIRKGMDLGADDYLTKPFKLGDLLRAINKRLEKKRKLNEKIQNITESITKYIPHELRTPLVAISGFSDIILKDFESLRPEEIYSMVERIKSGSKRLHGTIEKFLTFMEIELILKNPEYWGELSGKVLTEPNEFIRTATLEKISKAGRESDLKIQQKDNFPIYIPAYFFKIIVTELLENSLKFSEAGSKIELDSYFENNFYKIKIRDNGSGMTDEQIASINPFTQFNREQLQQNGNGLGLITIKNIINICGGSMNIESRLGEYTEVTITLRMAGKAA